MDSFLYISSELGVPIAENKTLGPTTCITFLGLDIDTLTMVVNIPENKKLKLGVEILLEEKKVKLRELEPITGLMAFCSRAIPSARAFTRRLYDLISSVKYKKPYYIRINSEVKADALVRYEFFVKFNGECSLPETLWMDNDRIELFKQFRKWFFRLWSLFFRPLGSIQMA
jgi:hypothetical protein